MENVVLITQLHGTSWFVNRAQHRYPVKKNFF